MIQVKWKTSARDIRGNYRNERKVGTIKGADTCKDVEKEVFIGSTMMNERTDREGENGRGGRV